MRISPSSAAGAWPVRKDKKPTATFARHNLPNCPLSLSLVYSQPFHNGCLMHDQGLLGLKPCQGCPHSGQGKSSTIALVVGAEMDGVMHKKHFVCLIAHVHGHLAKHRKHLVDIRLNVASVLCRVPSR